MPQRSLTSLLALGCVMVACVEPTPPATEQIEPAWANLGKSCPADAPAYSLPRAARDSLPTDGRDSRTLDEVWAEIAREVPGGWGGLFYEEGSLTIYLVERSKREQAIAALAPLLRESGWEEVADELATAEVKVGRWDFAQLHDWYRYLNQHVWRVEGVTTSDIDEQHNRLEYGVRDEEAQKRLSERLAELDPPCFLVAVGIRVPVALS